MRLDVEPDSTDSDKLSPDNLRGTPSFARPLEETLPTIGLAEAFDLQPPAEGVETPPAAPTLKSTIGKK